MLRRGGSAAAARGLLVLGSELQVRDGLHQLGLRLLQETVDVLGAVLGQRCPLLLPVPLGSLRTAGRAHCSPQPCSSFSCPCRQEVTRSSACHHPPPPNLLSSPGGVGRGGHRCPPSPSRTPLGVKLGMLPRLRRLGVPTLQTPQWPQTQQGGGWSQFLSPVLAGRHKDRPSRRGPQTPPS